MPVAPPPESPHATPAPHSKPSQPAVSQQSQHTLMQPEQKTFPVKEPSLVREPVENTSHQPDQPSPQPGEDSI